jgi:hypothetical protein
MNDDSGDCQPEPKSWWSFLPIAESVDQSEYVWSPAIEKIYQRPKLNEVKADTPEEQARLWKLVEEFSR